MTGATVRLPRVARAIEVLRTEGVRSFWFKALGETTYRRVVVMERSLDEAIVPVSSRTSVVIGLLSDGDEYATFRPDTDPPEIRRRLLAGHLCFVARQEGRIVSACWSATGRVWIHYLGRELVLAPDTVYQYDSFTTPGFRGRNIAALRGTEVARYFRAAGYRRLVGIILPENHAALRPPEKVGYRVTGIMGYVGIGRWRRHFYWKRRPTLTPLPSYWDEVVEESLRGAPLDQWRAYMRRIYGRLIQEWLPSGTGWGLKTDLFEEAITSHNLLPLLGPEGIGLDCSSATVMAARHRLRAAGNGYEFAIADLRAIPLRTDAVDHILAGSSLDHFSNKADIGRSLRELARVLRPGGTLVITLDNPHNPVIWLRNRVPFPWLKRLGLVPYYVGQTYSRSEARAQLESAGLTVKEMRAVAHAPRAAAIWIVALIERLNAARLERLLARALDAFESIERWPTCYRTGYYLALRAEKP